MVNFIRRQFAGQVVTKGYSRPETPNTRLSLNADYLTVVFAWRFAAYKRPTLILQDKERFKKILTNPAKPIQAIFSGKAHPADQQSKETIREVIAFAREHNVEDRVIFLENYDINIARHLCWGADLWLNTPAENMEASGTSGIKAAMNGVLHISTLEGWWREGYQHGAGWVITAGSIYDKQDLKDIADANQLYDLLEHEAASLFYDRNEADIPEGWTRMMKNSIFSICQNFNINRVLSDYSKKPIFRLKSTRVTFRQTITNYLSRLNKMKKKSSNIGIISP